MADREAVGDAVGVGGRLEERHLDGRLCRAVKVPQRQCAPELRGELLPVGQQERLAGARDLAEGGQLAG